MGWDPDSFGPQISRVQVELYTPGYRVRGEMATRFRRVADILNLTGSTHLNVEQATVVEYSESGTATHSGSTVMVAVEAVLFGISTGVDDSANPDLVVQKRPVRIDIAALFPVRQVDVVLLLVHAVIDRRVVPLELPERALLLPVAPPLGPRLPP